jgi:predicted RNA-binding Zn ribbon-like protein
MNEANSNLSLGSAAWSAKRAAALVAILHDRPPESDSAPLLDELNEALRSYGESSLVVSGDLSDLRIAADRLYTVFATLHIDDTALLLNSILNDYARAPRLSAHGGTPWHLHVDANDHAPWATWFAASSALALGILLSEKQHIPGGLCASPPCGKPFIDLGKGGGRTYCSPRCATRERVAAYRKKQAS